GVFAHEGQKAIGTRINMSLNIYGSFKLLD
nr:hypothetical protein [Tanacetum cinerariifolium]